MTMTDKQLRFAYSEAANYTDPDAFASDILLSAMFLPPEDETANLDTAQLENLYHIWHVANDPFKVLLRSIGITQTRCAERFCIPLRTVQHWALGERACPSYVRLMMAELTGYMTR